MPDDEVILPPEPHPRVADWFDRSVCGNCHAAKLLHWQVDEGDTLGERAPTHAVDLDPHFAAVHCDYFRRRIELPELLTYCGAQREITPGLNRWPHPPLRSQNGEATPRLAAAERR